MRAVMYLGDRRFEAVDREPRAPGAGEARIEVAFTGICGTDLHIFHGDMDSRVTVPVVIGHEMSGRIAELGPGVTGWSLGDPVTVIPLDWDGTCPACTAGHEHICQNLNFIGIDSPGSMQQSWTVPARTLVKLPAQLSLREAALVEPTAVAAHDVRRAGVVAGERVVVVGGGPVGLLIALVAREAGGNVMVVEPSKFRRGIADDQGLRCVDPQNSDVAALVGDWTDGAGASVAFEVSGAAQGVGLAVDVLGVRGRLCMVAIHPAPREVNLHRFFWRELTMVGARLYRREDFDRAIDLIAAGTIPCAQMISRVVNLDHVPEAFAALGSGDSIMKVLIDCHADRAPEAV
jgi:(R,R)-butanediol dehydrogenase/meso-butanediol dehydrogenase/diacetyl reductase